MTDRSYQGWPLRRRLVEGARFVMLLLLSAQAAPPDPGVPNRNPDDGITVTGRVAPAGPLPGGPHFISPMGEPFQSPDHLSGAEHWFVRTDVNHNGRLTLEEFQQDARDFFAKLDIDHDEEIGPIEIERYENEIAPEIKVTSTYGDVSQVKTDNDGNVTEAPYPKRLGAGLFGYLAMPEPVTYADANMDRAITENEFRHAAQVRFKMLDMNGDGVITRDELPRLRMTKWEQNP